MIAMAAGCLLTDAIAVPERGDIPRHERFYYLELLRRAGIVSEIPKCRIDSLERRLSGGGSWPAAIHCDGD